MKHFIDELRRRHVFRFAVAYLAGAWLLVQVLETLFPIFGVQETRIRWIVMALAAGFVPALALAWAFAWTPEGIRKESDAGLDTRLRSAGSRRADRVVIVVLAVAVGYFAFDKFVLDADHGRRAGSATTGPVSIAVMPFLDLSEGQDQAYFADGMSEELMNLLARIPELRVASRTSSFSYKGKDVGVAEIAQALNVSHVLEGSVRKAGDQVRVTVQLIDAADGYHILSETYDRRDGNALHIQDEIARNTVESLRLRVLGGVPQVEATDPRAHVLYLRGLYLERQGSQETMEQAVALFEEALAIDPDYAAAWVALSVVYGNQTADGLRSEVDGYTLSRHAALEALKIDPANAAAYDRLCWIARVYDADLSAAAAHCSRALELNPASDITIGHAAVLTQSLGRLDEAIALHEYTVSRAPADSRASYNLALAYYFADRLDDAERTIRKVLVMSPDYYSAWYRLGTILLLQGRSEEAREAFAKEADEEFRVKGRAMAAFALGEEVEARAALAELEKRWGEEWPSEVAHVYAYRGEKDAAFEWLEKDYKVAGAAGWGEWRLMRDWDNLRGDPRWQEFLHKVGVSDEQLAAIRFEVKIPGAATTL